MEKVEEETNKYTDTMKMMHISFILIFMAHATVSEETKQAENASDSEILESIFRTRLPSF